MTNMQLKVLIAHNGFLEFEVDNTKKISELKQEIYLRSNLAYPPANQLLVYSENILEDDTTIGSLNIEKGRWILMIMQNDLPEPARKKCALQPPEASSDIVVETPEASSDIVVETPEASSDIVVETPEASSDQMNIVFDLLPIERDVNKFNRLFNQFVHDVKGPRNDELTLESFLKWCYYVSLLDFHILQNDLLQNEFMMISGNKISINLEQLNRLVHVLAGHAKCHPNVIFKILEAARLMPEAPEADRFQPAVRT